MRRALWMALAAAFGLTALAGLTGWAAWLVVGTPVGLEAAGPVTAHFITGVACALACAVVASMAFVLGLVGLLETGARRLPAGLLFVLAPVLMGLAFATARPRGAAESPGQGPPSSLELRQHAIFLGGSLAAALTAVAAATAWAHRRHPDADEV